MDLTRLKIERQQSPQPATRNRGRARSAWPLRLTLLLLLTGLIWIFRSPLGGLVDRFRLPAVETVLVQKPSLAAASAVSGKAANGYVVARVRAALSADTPGRIVELNVSEGQAVKKGFVVARLYAEEYEAALKRAEADLQVADAFVLRAQAEARASRNDLERLESTRSAAAADLVENEAQQNLARLEHERVAQLVRDGFESQQNLDRAAAELDSSAARRTSAEARFHAAGSACSLAGARIEVEDAAVVEAGARVAVQKALREQAQALLNKTIIRAPFDGVVVLKDAEVGEVVSPNSQAGGSARGSVVTMVDFSSLEVQAEVPETSLTAVRLGASALIFLDACPEKPYPAEVDRIWPTADRQKATIEVRLRFLERDDRLRPEMGVRVVFTEAISTASGEAPAETEALLLVPANALIRENGKDGVFVLERDTVRFRAITLGPRQAERVGVLSGLQENERIVLSPPTTLADGDRVRIQRGP